MRALNSKKRSNGYVVGYAINEERKKLHIDYKREKKIYKGKIAHNKRKQTNRVCLAKKRKLGNAQENQVKLT
jgi:hypothetical protein